MTRAVILGSTPLAARTVSRAISCGGVPVEIAASFADLPQPLPVDQPYLLCTGSEHLGEVISALQVGDAVWPLLWCGESSDGLVCELSRYPRANHIFGLRYPDAPPRSWELVAVMRRWASPGQPPPLDQFVSWGAARLEQVLSTDGDRDAMVAAVEEFCLPLVGDRVATSVAELAHELLMNAMYDAPVDAAGQPRFAYDRTASIRLEPPERPSFLCACDGSRLVCSVVDPFGRLRREHVFGGLARALSSGEVDVSGGGAGLGILKIYRASTLVFFDVIPGRRTQVTAVLELDVPPREQRRLPRSIHFFSQD